MNTKDKNRITVLCVLIVCCLVIGLIGWTHFHNGQSTSDNKNAITNQTSQYVQTKINNNPNMKKYGYAVYDKINNTIVFHANNNVAQQIKHGKVKDNVPGKYTNMARNQFNQLKQHTQNKNAKMKLLPNN